MPECAKKAEEAKKCKSSNPMGHELANAVARIEVISGTAPLDLKQNFKYIDANQPRHPFPLQQDDLDEMIKCNTCKNDILATDFPNHNKKCQKAKAEKLKKKKERVGFGTQMQSFIELGRSILKLESEDSRVALERSLFENRDVKETLEKAMENAKEERLKKMKEQVGFSTQMQELTKLGRYIFQIEERESRNVALERSRIENWDAKETMEIMPRNSGCIV